jgi:hypothetical protein
MRGMRLDDDRATRRQRRRRIAAGDRKRQWKIARAKDRDRSKRTQHRPKIGPGSRFAIRLHLVDPGIDPRTLFHQFGEHAKLTDGAPKLSIEPTEGQAGLKVRALDQLRSEVHEFFRDRSQQSTASCT